MSNGTDVEVGSEPVCDIHKYLKSNPNVPARVDGRTTSGRWAHMCGDCFVEVGTGLGVGFGQRLHFITCHADKDSGGWKCLCGSYTESADFRNDLAAAERDGREHIARACARASTA